MALILLALPARPLAWAADPPPDLARKAAAREAENESARSNYVYRQTLTVEELDDRGLIAGHYHEVRDVIFSPTGARSEQPVGKPVLALKRLRLTPEDFQDLREVQPFLFTPDRLFLYQTRYRGEEDLNGIPCWLLQVSPRQILQGQRLFDGVFWISQRDFSILRSDGQAVPNLYHGKEENLFPHFTTERAQIDGAYWFPAKTSAADTLWFRNGPLRMRLSVRYSNYQRFGSQSSIRFDDQP